MFICFFFFSSRRRHTRCLSDWSSDVCSSDLVALDESIRAKYAGIVMDTAWALFEIRMHHDPAADPNQVWTDITRRYFRIRPHPEMSWWAVRGQLVNAPGYMLNYALGAILIADLRARAREAHGPYVAGDPTW